MREVLFFRGCLEGGRDNACERINDHENQEDHRYDFKDREPFSASEWVERFLHHQFLFTTGLIDLKR